MKTPSPVPALTVALTLLLGLIGIGHPPAFAANPPSGAEPAKEATEGAAGRMVVLQKDDYRRLLARKAEESLRRDPGTARRIILSRATYAVRVQKGEASVRAEYRVQSRGGSGWEIIRLAGGRIAVTGFHPPAGASAYLTIQGLASSPETVLRRDATYYMVGASPMEGSLVLEFQVPILEFGGGRQLTFTVPPVPMATLDMTVDDPADGVTISPSGLVETGPLVPGFAVHKVSHLRSGDTVSITWNPRTGAKPGTAGTKVPQVKVDRSLNLVTVGTDHVTINARLDVEAGAAPVSRLTLVLPEGGLLQSVRARPGSAVNVRAAASDRLNREIVIDPPISRQMAKIDIEAQLSMDPHKLEAELTPINIEYVKVVREGVLAFDTEVPVGLNISPPADFVLSSTARLPADFPRSPYPPLECYRFHHADKAFKARFTRRALLRPLDGVIQRMEAVTNMTGQSGFRTHCKLTLTATAEVLRLICADKNQPQSVIIDGVRLPPVTAPDASGRVEIPLTGSEHNPITVEFDLNHPAEFPHGFGALAVSLPRFDLPVQESAWTLVQPESVRFYNYQGSGWRELEKPQAVFIQRFLEAAIDLARRMLLALTEPTNLLLMMLLGFLVLFLRSNATGRPLLDVTMSQPVMVGVAVLLVLMCAALIGSTGVTPVAPGSRQGPAASDPPSEPPRPVDVPVSLAGDTSDADRTGRMLGESPAASRPADPKPEPVAPTPAVTPPPLNHRVTFTRSLILGADEPEFGSSETTLAPSPAPPAATTLSMTYFERRWEFIPDLVALMTGLVLFLSLFLYSQELLDRQEAALAGAASLIVAALLDARVPFATTFAFAGFGFPILLMLTIQATYAGVQVYEGWREEGERFRNDETSSRRSPLERGHGMSNSNSGVFGRGGNKNEVAIKDIFSDPPPEPPPPPAAPAAPDPGPAGADTDGIDFVDTEEEGSHPESEEPKADGEKK